MQQHVDACISDHQFDEEKNHIGSELISAASYFYEMCVSERSFFYVKWIPANLLTYKVMYELTLN